MKPNPVASATTLAIVLRTMRCFNTAAFTALAFFYFASYCLPAAPFFALQLLPSAAATHPTTPSLSATKDTQ
ncbi:hypothetical protein IV454_26370 [Massilia antarctica]|uniref:Uncharacterized protein n=1 Tax=Massilia antarctica TaxID=2765360 RepID=A0AA48WC29_9BURK|nr:hypothetical protein [Massilia antarctica]QPI48973.1 hypothetical protein IV454_26370 [Massilia antarctica]